MPEPAVTVLHGFFCDHVQVHDGKAFAMGVYGSECAVDAVPTQLPTFAFYARLTNLGGVGVLGVISVGWEGDPPFLEAPFRFDPKGDVRGHVVNALLPMLPVPTAGKLVATVNLSEPAESRASALFSLVFCVKSPPREVSADATPAAS